MSSMLVMLSGKVIDWSDWQLQNTPPFILSRCWGRVIDLSEVHDIKALVPILVTLSGQSILSRLWQVANALL